MREEPQVDVRIPSSQQSSVGVGKIWNKSAELEGVLVRDAGPMPTENPLITRIKPFASLVSHFLLHLYSLEGQYQGRAMRAVVADDGTTLNYARRLIFPEGCEVAPKGAITATRASRLAMLDADLVFTGANRLLFPEYRRQGFRIIPKWVSLVMPLHKHPDDFISELPTSRRKDIQRGIRRMIEAGFQYYLTNDPEWYDWFYNTMYAPYATGKFANEARLLSYKALQKVYEEGVALVITLDGQDVAGSINRKRLDVWQNLYLGFAGGDNSIARSGASSALYYYSLIEAHKNGCTSINFGYSRPFLSDGILTHKLRWGMQIEDEDPGTAAFALISPNNSEVAQDFLNANRHFELTHQEKTVLRDELDA